MKADETPGGSGDPPGMASPRERLNRVNPLVEFRRLKQVGSLTPNVATHLASEAVEAILKQHTVSGNYPRDAVTLLCELATLDDAVLARSGSQGLFPLLVEPLGDAFTPAACALYNQLFAQVIQYCRQQPEGASIDRYLRHFGVITEDDLLTYAARVRAPSHFSLEDSRQIKKAFVLSRVTLGADVAVSSIVLAALKEICPQAEIKLVANAKTMQLFAGDPRVQLCAIEYPRGGRLIERLTSWLCAVEVLHQETMGLDPTEYVIVDPDSRLTQLGILPLVADQRPYLFFESRSYCAAGLQKLGALTAHWLQQIFGSAESIYPYCAPSQPDVAAAQRIIGALKRYTTGPIVSLSLGVGSNPAKRLPDPFEFRLLVRLLSEGATVILDKGGDAEEVGRIDTLVTMLGREGFHALALDERRDVVASPTEVGGATLLTWQGGIGRFASLIAETYTVCRL